MPAFWNSNRTSATDAAPATTVKHWPEPPRFTARISAPKGNYPAAAWLRASIAHGVIRDRVRSGLPQRELTRLAGIRVETLCRIETGKHTATVPTSTASTGRAAAR